MSVNSVCAHLLAHQQKVQDGALGGTAEEARRSRLWSDGAWDLAKGSEQT